MHCCGTPQRPIVNSHLVQEQFWKLPFEDVLRIF